MPIFSGVATEMPSGPSNDSDTDIRVAADYRDRCAGHGETVGVGYVQVIMPMSCWAEEKPA